MEQYVPTGTYLTYGTYLGGTGTYLFDPEGGRSGEERDPGALLHPESVGAGHVLARARGYILHR